MRPRSTLTRMGLLLAALLLYGGQALAHRSSAAGSTEGLPIASLSHGEMTVIARYRDDIFDLAAQVRKTDEPFRRLVNFGNIQYSYCLWGVVPGSISDEASPFNECAHAYLAAARAVLLSLRDRPDVALAAAKLVSDIDADLVVAGSALTLCRYSEAGFNTADVMRPHWSDVPVHPPSLASFAGVGIITVLGVTALAGRMPFPRRRDT